MTTTQEAVDAIVRHIGFDPPRTKAVARALTESGRLPAGTPGKAPELEPHHVIDIALGCAVDAPLRAIAAAVARYRALTPGGVDLTGAPASIDTAGGALDVFAEIAINGMNPDLARSDQIEIVSSWPEIAIYCDGKVLRFVEPGALASHWQSRGHRSSTTINGAALVDVLRQLFGEV